MFAGAAREAVFSKPEVVRRIKADFVPVALKAALVNNPPRGVEGQLYAEIGRSKPVPQGICVANSAGKVLDWVVSFDDDQSVLKFLDHCVKRYAEFPDAAKPVAARRYMRFPSRKLHDVADNGKRLRIPERHDGDRCPGTPAVERGTLVGRVIGRVLGKDGKPVADTIRQEHYMEARFEVPIGIQRRLSQALADAGDKRFKLPDEVVHALVSHAYLGQLDVNPLGGRRIGGKSDRQSWEFWAQRIDDGTKGTTRIRIEGKSDVAGSQAENGGRGDGRLWDHEVKLTWQGYVGVQDGRVKHLALLARGTEKLRWGNQRLRAARGSDVTRLPAGHPIDLSCGVVYGLIAKP